MTIQVTGKNLDVGEALRSYVQERVVHTVEKFIGREPTGHVRIEKEHGEFRTNCTIHLWQGMSLEAHGVAPDAYQSADLACERLEKRVRRYKRRLKRHGGGETPRKQTPAADYVIQASPGGAEERDEDNPVIIAEAETSGARNGGQRRGDADGSYPTGLLSCFAMRATGRSTWSTAATTAISAGSILRGLCAQVAKR